MLSRHHCLKIYAITHGMVYRVKPLCTQLKSIRTANTVFCKQSILSITQNHNRLASAWWAWLTRAGVCCSTWYGKLAIIHFPAHVKHSVSHCVNNSGSCMGISGCDHAWNASHSHQVEVSLTQNISDWQLLYVYKIRCWVHRMTSMSCARTQYGTRCTTWFYSVDLDSK